MNTTKARQITGPQENADKSYPISSKYKYADKPTYSFKFALLCYFCNVVLN